MCFHTPHHFGDHLRFFEIFRILLGFFGFLDFQSVGALKSCKTLIFTLPITLVIILVISHIFGFLDFFRIFWIFFWIFHFRVVNPPKTLVFTPQMTLVTIWTI